jgi:hypothetical protein
MKERKKDRLNDRMIHLFNFDWTIRRERGGPTGQEVDHANWQRTLKRK